MGEESLVAGEAGEGEGRFGIGGVGGEEGADLALDELDHALQTVLVGFQACPITFIRVSVSVTIFTCGEARRSMDHKMSVGGGGCVVV